MLLLDELVLDVLEEDDDGEDKLLPLPLPTRPRPLWEFAKIFLIFDEWMRGNAILENVCGFDEDGDDIGEPLVVAFNFRIVVAFVFGAGLSVRVVGGVSVWIVAVDSPLIEVVFFIVDIVVNDGGLALVTVTEFELVCVLTWEAPTMLGWARQICMLPLDEPYN